MATISEALASALVHHQAGRLAEAEQIYRQILAAEENQPQAWHLLGVLASQAGRHEVAVEYIGRAIRIQGDVAVFHVNQGAAYRALRRIPEALGCYRRALELKPDFAEAHYNLGVAFMDQGKPDEALACFRRASELRPDSADAHNSLGAAFKEAGNPEEALACYRRALQLRPDSAEFYNNLGTVATTEEALACYRRAVELKPDYGEAHSNLLLTLHYRQGVTLAELADAHAEFDRRHAAPLGRGVARHENARDAQKRLRLGFVSPDLRQHPVGRLLIRVLENLRHRQQETVCYSSRAIHDDLTNRLQAAASRWRDVAGLSDQGLAQQIRADQIDILFDLAGHTARNRMLVFARKPAPLQITWLGYEGTTGLSAMDYLLADRHMVPEESQRHYREQVLRMPAGYVCFDPPAAAPPVGPLPARGPGDVTLGSFNNLAKITPEVARVWAEILRRLPQGRLVLKYRELGSASVQQRYRELFAACGVAPGRLTLLPFSTYTECLAAYRQIDLALDPFPFSGSATTCDALWMGVPVVTCPGETFASRHSLSHLSNVGLTETIARDLHEYVEIAVALANDLPRLADIRARLRQQMAASPLCDGPRFAANLMALLGDVWRRWCEGRDEG